MRIILLLAFTLFGSVHAQDKDSDTVKPKPWEKVWHGPEPDPESDKPWEADPLEDEAQSQDAIDRRFNCRAGSSWSFNDPIVLVLTIDESLKRGTVTVADQTFKAKYSVEGVSRRWDWGPAGDSTFDYTIVLRPDTIAVFYDFTRAEVSEEIKGSISFNCRERKS